MQLFVVRHGIAYEREEWNGSDFDRPLTDEGRKKTKAVMKALRKDRKLAVDAIWSSPLARALQTAEIAGKEFGLPVKVVESLACGATLDDVTAAMAELKPVPARLMLVGHEPDGGRLIAALTGDLPGEYALKKAGSAALEGDFKPGGMTLLWKLAPKDLL
jgi:phosphohistidine phosphatase